MEVAASAGGGGGAKAPKDVIAKHCNACHGTGLLGAPKIGDAAAWKERAKTTKGGLDGHAGQSHYRHQLDAAKGTCADCADDELKGAIKEMSGLYQSASFREKACERLFCACNFIKCRCPL